MRARVDAAILACVAAVSLTAPAALAQGPARGRTVVINEGAQSGYLGIGVADITSERAKALNLKEERGAEVTSVNVDSPAAKAGVQKGDVVLEYNGQTVQGTAQLTRLVRETPAGRQVRIVVSRNGSNQTLSATIEPRKNVMVFGDNRLEIPEGAFRGMAIPSMPPMDIPQFQMAWRSPMLGIVGEGLGGQPQLAEFFGVKDGVLVKSVTKGSPAEKAGLKAGDVVVKLDDTRVTSTEEIRKAMSSLMAKNAGSTFTVVVVRNKKEMPVQVTLEKATGDARPFRASRVAINC
jgi:serine protease Do